VLDSAAFSLVSGTVRPVTSEGKRAVDERLSGRRFLRIGTAEMYWIGIHREDVRKNVSDVIGACLSVAGFGMGPPRGVLALPTESAVDVNHGAGDVRRVV
jgi:hypothetical protein